MGWLMIKRKQNISYIRINLDVSQQFRGGHMFNSIDIKNGGLANSQTLGWSSGILQRRRKEFREEPERSRTPWEGSQNLTNLDS